MLKPVKRQSSFYDADYICEQLIPQNSFYRKFREIVAPLLKDKQFESMYCKDNGRPSISPSLLAMATILQFHKNLSDREMERACMYDIEIKYALGLALDERPFDHSSLGDFRKRLLENGKEKEILNKVGLQFYFTAAAVNIKRWIKILMDKMKPKIKEAWAV